MKNALSPDRRHRDHAIQFSPWREVDRRHEHDEGVHKLFSDNRARYIALSAATRGGVIPKITEAA